MLPLWCMRCRNTNGRSCVYGGLLYLLVCILVYRNSVLCNLLKRLKNSIYPRLQLKLRSKRHGESLHLNTTQIVAATEMCSMSCIARTRKRTTPRSTALTVVMRATCHSNVGFIQPKFYALFAKAKRGYYDTRKLSRRR